MSDVEKSAQVVGDEPPWRSAFDDLLEAAALVYEESEREAIRASLVQNQVLAAQSKERARALNRAAALLDWMAGRADSLHLLRKPRPRERRP